MEKSPPVVTIFQSTRTIGSAEEYSAWLELLERKVVHHPGYVSHVGFRDAETRRGVTIVYFEDLASLEAWGRDREHQDAQGLGRSAFYEEYTIDVAQVVRSRRWRRED